MAHPRGREDIVSEGEHSQGQPGRLHIKGNDYRLVAALQYRAGAVAIRFFGTHGEYDKIDAETV